MKMIEISLRSLANEMNKLIEKKVRIEKKLEKATDKVEKLDCKWTWEEHREWLLNVPTEEGWIKNKEDVKKNGAWFDWRNAQDDLEVVNGRIERLQSRIEKAEATLQEAEKWRDKLRVLHNDLAFMGDTVDTHYVCDKLYALIKESEDE